MYYRVTDRWAVRVSGDRIGASFSLINNSPQLGNSPHRTWNGSATLGLVCHF
jgi:hypothetical protein